MTDQTPRDADPGAHPPSDPAPAHGAAPARPRDAGGTRATPDAADEETGRPLKQHGDALLDGSGSRQGSPPDPEMDAAPHE